ncbi:hypothetical protein BO71DRAFT_113502 [Aspergillus ellipticus CBS 707.79]|uniref:Uncharacterized protein n=1 Tax=Aspergillus ellipticus CBS 707.79 TaxID=1448320 RepID=A0A319CWG9_9EURO|nr:hypothetical protein BO71DRAFT_113502 [Aspergillus ellipticus CBS 707.79]
MSRMTWSITAPACPGDLPVQPPGASTYLYATLSMLQHSQCRQVRTSSLQIRRSGVQHESLSSSQGGRCWTSYWDGSGHWWRDRPGKHWNSDIARTREYILVALTVKHHNAAGVGLVAWIATAMYARVVLIAVHCREILASYKNTDHLHEMKTLIAVARSHCCTASLWLTLQGYVASYRCIRFLIQPEAAEPTPWNFQGPRGSSRTRESAFRPRPESCHPRLISRIWMSYHDVCTRAHVHEREVS